MSRRHKLIVIVGPTASGKSELAVRLAKKLNGEIISADSRQIYRGLDIGTGKIKGKWRHLPFIPATAGIQITKQRKTGSPIKPGMTIQTGKKVFIYKNIFHHCIDFVSPKKIFTVAEFKQYAETAIKDITNRGKIPILAGGTGFWIDTVVYNLKLPSVRPNPKLRRNLERKTPKELLTMLKEIDLRRAKTIEQKNKRRLIRAIEIAKTIGKVPPLRHHSPYQTIWIGLNPPYEIWSHGVERRTQEMIQRGLLHETRRLLASDVSKKRIKEFGFEYRAALDVIEKRILPRDLLSRLVADTSEYARRQRIWFKRNRQINWFRNAREILASRKIYRKLIPSH